MVLAFLYPCLAFAQSDSSTVSKTSAGAGGALVTYLICNSQKRRPIGGWLLYFYIQLYGGALISLVILSGVRKNFDPTIWEDKALFTLYLISTIPSYIAMLAEVLVGSMLLAKRFKNPQTVNSLRIVLAASFVFGLLGLLIDSAHWPKNVAMDLLPAAMSLLWFFYFTKSTRVRLVFKEGNWDSNIMYPPKLV